MMISPPVELTSGNLLERAREGDQEAWQILFEECYPKIVRVVRRRLSIRMRKIYDSTDIANDVMKSLAAKFYDFDFSSINGLKAFLIHAAEQKLIDSHRRGHAKKRDLDRDRSYGQAGNGEGWEVADSSPTASQVAVASEEEELLLDRQTGPSRAVIELKLQGFTNSEVARETGWHLRKVERFLETLRGRLRL